MTEWINSFVAGPKGPVNTGSGHQTNYSIERLVLEERTRGKDPRELAEDDLFLLERRFIAPSGLGQGREILRQGDTVLLTGSPGSGKRAAAQMLLHELRHEQGRFYELSDAPEDDKAVLDSDIVSDHDRILLDLTNTEERRFLVVLDELPAFRAAMRRHLARLAIVLPVPLRHLCPDELRGRTAEVGRPDEIAVFRRHLRCHDIDTPTEDLHSAELERHLAHSPMRDVALLADLVRRARDAGRPGEPFTLWLSQALTALTEQGEKVASLYQRLETGEQRALLLATGILHGARADAIHHAAVALLEAAGHPVDETPLLERPDLARRLAEIEAGIDAQARVRFHALEYDTAVRAHFWDNHPALRPVIRVWVTGSVQLRMLTQDDRDALVRRFAEHTLRTEPADDLLSLARQWAGGDAYDIFSRAAAWALKQGLQDERHGSAFRRQIYDWARHFEVPQGLGLVLVQVCSEVMSVTHPDQAMVRLHHLAKRGGRATADAARLSLVQLSSGDNRLYRRLLDRVTRGLAHDRSKADEELFLSLADPIRLTDTARRTAPFIADSSVRAQYAQCWGVVLGRPNGTSWRPRVEEWLQACCTGRRCAELLLDVLALAGEHRNGLTSLLYTVALDWAEAPPEGRRERMAVADQLWQKADASAGAASAPFTV
ncbi:ATP-binding protein [Streptomyces chrestomyceticus]|uniref:ATP-binding protein n=1 Tax=Streptomyces chrestomyceticus TaxID=68185 RepID=UPI0036B35D84